mgnify:CR=1 FL=1|tara:strand:- start:19213 stop:19569 length:357 start_codon:yes stop_codon:yes gene_type:complete
MAIPPKGNSGTSYYNINQCRTFGMKLTLNTLTCLSGNDVSDLYAGAPCSEVIILNKTTGTLSVYDQATTADTGIPWVLETGETFTFRGLTNVNQVSAKAAATGYIQYRTQFFSSNPAR